MSQSRNRPAPIVGAFDLWSEAGGTLVVAGAIPFYIGLLDLTLLQFLIYCGVAGATLAVGEHLRFCGFRRIGVNDLVGDTILWGVLVLGIGLFAYLVGWFLI